MKQIKLVVTDMDGTLLDSKGDLPPGFFKVLDRLHQAGIRFGVASGRQYYALYNKMNNKAEEVIYIAENGSVVLEKGEVLAVRPLKKETAMEIVRILKEIGGKHIIVCTREKAYIEDTSPEFMKPFLQHYDRYEVVDDLLDVSVEEVLKVTVCDLSGAEENTLPHVEHLKTQLNVKLSGDIWIDFNHRDAHKGNALADIQKLYGLSAEETMVFGDYLNDLELFDHATYGYAMANAHEEVLAKAPFRTKSNDEYGVMLVLEALLEGLE